MLVLAIAASLALSACQREPTATDAAAPGTTRPAPQDETADAFIARVNAELKEMYPELTAAQWLSNTYIIDDSQLLAAKATELATWRCHILSPSRGPISPHSIPREINISTY